MNVSIYIVSEYVQNICKPFQHICSIHSSKFTKCHRMFPTVFKTLL